MLPAPAPAAPARFTLARVRSTLFSSSLVIASLVLTACVPPSEHLDGRSADGRTRVAIELQPAGGDSVRGSGTLQLAGKPRVVELKGRWNDVGDGVRSLEATLQADTTPDERWALDWSPVTLNGSLRAIQGAEGHTLIALNTP
jgi:hypothetical protein